MFGLQNNIWLLQHQEQDTKKVLPHPKINCKWLIKLFFK